MKLFQVGVVTHALECLILCQVMGQLHLKNELSCKVGVFFAFD